jgi:predicted DNA-binding transcriptional regulator AlpA
MTYRTGRGSPDVSDQRGTMTAVSASPYLLTHHEVCCMLSISRSTLNRWVREDPEFPQARRCGGRTIRWVAAELRAYIDSRPRVAYDDHAFDPNALPDCAEGVMEG